MMSCLLGLALAGALLAALTPAPALAGIANSGIPGAPAGNPLAGMPWGVYHGPLDGIDPAYRGARGRNRRLLAKIALRPTAHWFGAWDTDASAADLAGQYIRASTRGGPTP